MLGIAILALMLFVAALIDILRSQHLATSTKAVWVLATLVFPFLGPVAWFLFGRRDAPSVNEPLVNSR
ncbi:phosphotransferase system glucose/maltose/N-acetylglucosamine-specific IIC component [Arthrobacter sp. CAN_A212]|uniref:PLD nuclease N-terminal domain-containing protein n=1 Tax=Arthrobacter sp. CAN_A212 TaxID=2787719 RepID=UPI0018C93DA5